MGEPRETSDEPRAEPAGAPPGAGEGAGAPPTPQPARAEWTSAVLTGITAHFLLRALAVCVSILLLSSPPLGAENRLVIALEPLGLAVAASVLLAAWHRRPADSRAVARVVVAGYALTLSIYYYGPFGMVARDMLSWAMLPALVVATAATRASRSRPAALRGPRLLAVTLVLAAAFHAAWPPLVLRSVVNRYGLVASRPGTTFVERAKGEYPACTARFNSLGYRDEEPPPPGGGRRTVLLVGDSFVWGDGIAVAEDTLGSLLRNELSRAAPDRYAVVVAAHRGLGLYGYDRAVEALAPVVRPDVVVIGLIDGADEDPLDPQFLADGFPRAAWARNFVLSLRATQYLHTVAGVLRDRLWRRPENKAYFAALRERLAQRAAREGYRVVFLRYFEPPDPPPLPPTVGQLHLPEWARYPDHPSDLWYGDDVHPKPPLNRELAKMLAREILAAGRGP